LGVPGRPRRIPCDHAPAGAYNHHNGGIDDGSYQRLDEQLHRLAALELDALLSTEAKSWFDNGRRGLHLAARRLGMQPLWVRAPRHDCNLVIFVRTGRLQVLEERHEQGHPWWHGQARVVVAVDDVAEPLWLVAAHLAPFNPEIRAARADFVDVGAALFPDPRDRQPTAGIPRAPVRCDRIYVSDRLRHTPVAYQVWDDDGALSDHRLVLAEIVLT